MSDPTSRLERLGRMARLILVIAAALAIFLLAIPHNPFLIYWGP